MLIFKIESLKV